jgi:hypothetical protein
LREAGMRFPLQTCFLQAYRGETATPSGSAKL